MNRFITGKAKAIGGLVVAMASLVATPHAPANERVYQQAIHSVVLIESSEGFGSGFVVDVARRLVVTANHVPGKEDSVTVYFPQQDSDGNIITERSWYLGGKNQKGIHGRVVGRSPAADVALVQLDTLPAGVRALSLGRARVGTEVHVIGNSSLRYGGAFGCRQGMVTNRYRGQIIRGNVGSCQLLETQTPQNHGDSGGPVINDRGEVVGIVHGGLEPTKENDYPNLVEFAIDSSEIQTLLDRVLPQLPSQ